MSALRRAIHLIIALALTVVGTAEFVYLYFFAEAPRGWITVAAGLMGCAGLYWLWDEYINPAPETGRLKTDAPASRSAPQRHPHVLCGIVCQLLQFARLTPPRAERGLHCAFRRTKLIDAKVLTQPDSKLAMRSL